MMDSGYQQEQLGSGSVRFTVTPAPVPRARGASIGLAGLFALLVMGSTLAHTGTLMLLIRLAIAGFGGWCVYRLTHRWSAGRVDRVRSPGGTFVISPSTIEVSSGALITREQLHRLVVRNGVPNAAEPTIVTAGCVYSGMPADAQNDRIASRGKAARVSYMLCAEAGARSTTLAGGMTKVTAHGLLTDVSRILSLGESPRSADQGVTINFRTASLPAASMRTK
jgi:hypothetical protein